MRGIPKALAVLAALVLAVTLAIFLLIHGPAPTAGAKPSSPATRNDTPKADAVPAVEAGEGTADAGNRDSLGAREALPAPSQAAHHSEEAIQSISRTGPGRIVVSAIDAQSREPLERFRVRAASGTRLADRQADRGKPSLQLSLTPDTYSLLVSSTGYEPAELPPVQVPPGKTIMLDPVELVPGSARIVGIVRGTGWSPDVVRVELLGEGRRPCPKCQFGADPERPGEAAPSLSWARGSPCAACGYAVKSSLLPVQRSGLFTFQSLAAGPYTLHLIDSQNRTLGVSKTIDLHAGESLPVELEYVVPRVVLAEIVDTDGKSLAPEWAARRPGRHITDADSVDDSVSVTSFGQPPEFHCAFRLGDCRLATTSFVSPPPPGHRSEMRPNPFGSRRLGFGGKINATDDRPRANSEPLRPDQQAPTVDPSTLFAHVNEDGLAEIEGVPSLALTLDMQCWDSLVATTEIPPSRDVTRVRIQLTIRRRLSSSPEAEATNPTPTFREFEASLWH